MTPDYRLTLILVLPLVVQLLLMCLAVTTDPYISRRHRIALYAVAGLTFLLVMENVIGFWLDYNGSILVTRTLVGIIGYCLRPTIIVLFFYIIGGEHHIKIAWILVIINALVYISAAFCKLTFWIDETNHFHRGPLGFTCHVISADLLLHLLIYSVRRFVRGKKREAIVPVLIVAAIIITVVIDTWVDYGFYPISCLDIAVVSSCVFFYIWLHMQFMREHEQALVAEQRIRIMMSQIQPHFLYNTLSTIQALCLTDPERASQVTEKFGRFLRQNLEAMNQTDLIPIQKEMENLMVFTEIQTVRFPKINVIYQVEDTSFSVPPLTVQPLVENAIRHGLRGRENSFVMIETRATDAGHEIIVTDNGRGFDLKILDETCDSGHIGIRNVRERIEHMCSGTLKIDSREGIGTTVTLFIPDK